MKITNYYQLKIILIIVVFIFINLFVSLILVRNRLDTQNYGVSFSEIVKPLRFQYTPRNDNFNIIILSFKNPALMNKSQFILKIYLNDMVLREVPFSGFNIGEVSDIKFQFEPITDSEGKNFEIEISGENYENPIFINVDERGKPSFRAYYRTLNKGQVFQNIMKSWEDNISDDLRFFIAWGILLFGVSFWGARHENT